jgi:hypothetical protein
MKQCKEESELRILINNRELVGVITDSDRLCGLVVKVHGYRSRGPGSIPGATKFSEK